MLELPEKTIPPLVGGLALSWTSKALIALVNLAGFGSG